MRPPAILTLQLLNMCVGGGQYLAFANAAGIWTTAGWSPWDIGLAMAGTNLAYALLVSQGGRLSDRWGRARTAVLGASICSTAALLALVFSSPVLVLVATILGCGGAAIFFPGNVGLFSDARSDSGAPDLPLHVKVSRYNLGWSGGNIAGFGLAFLLSTQPPRVGWAITLLSSVVCIVVLWRWIGLPPQTPPAAGDRAPHPALSRLTLMGRLTLLIHCLMGMAFISLLTRSLSGEGLSPDAAKSTANAALFCYALGYFAMFVLLGRWSGWILKPWRLMIAQLPVVLAAVGVLAVDWFQGGSLALCGCALLLGLGFGAIYTGSIYYSLRLPEGAARAAGLHETALGIGSTVGPLVCGGFMSVIGDGALGSLGWWMAVVSAVLFTAQVALIPGAVRNGAR